MKERPILFSGPMVRALLDGSKTQTRRVGKIQSPAWTELGVEYQRHATKGEVATATYRAFPDGGSARWGICECPYGVPGDRLWVKETFMPRYGGTLPNGKSFTNVRYRADEEGRDCFGMDHKGQVAINFGADKWRPSIFCTRWASRITLEITGIRVERLQEISEEDAAAEGVTLQRVPTGVVDEAAGVAEMIPEEPSEAYRRLWESINGPGSWDANPWVWVIEFKRLIQ